MAGADRRTVVGLVGGGLTVVLVAAAAVLVAGDHGPPGVFWDPALVVGRGAVEGPGSPPSSARDQLLLSLELEGVSNVLEVGQTTSFGLRLVNSTDESISLDPCPTYRVTYTAANVSAPGVPVPGPDTTPLAEMRGRFRCDDASELAGGESVEVEVFFDIAPSRFTSGGTVGTVAVELWPDVAGPHPEVGVFGVVVDRFDGQRPIEVPPGLEGIEGIEGVEGVEGVEGFRGTVVVEDP